MRMAVGVMSQIEQLVSAPPAANATIQYTDHATAPDTGTITYSNMNLGTPATDRYIIIGCSSRRTTIYTVTVAGVSATKLGEDSDINWETEIWIAAVPNGSTGDVVVTTEDEIRWVSVVLYRATGINSTPHAITGGGVYDDPVSFNIGTPNNGVAMAIATNNFQNLNHTWGSDFSRDISFGSDNSTDSTTSASISATDGSTVTCSVNFDTGDGRVLAASFAPA